VSCYRLIEKEKAHHAVSRLARVLGVARAGYYAWAGRPLSQRTVADQALTEQIRQIHARSRGTYGAPRVHAELCRLELRCGCKRVARLMRTAGLVGVHARRRWRHGRPDTERGAFLSDTQFHSRRIFLTVYCHRISASYSWLGPDELRPHDPRRRLWRHGSAEDP